MDTKTFLSSVSGQWQGEYKLWLDPSKDPENSDSSLVIKPTANGSYVLIHYNWSFRDAPKAGVFLLGGKDDNAIATWGDCFHMEPLPMVCEGSIKNGVLILNGSYPAGDVHWGWRTEFSQLDDQFVMRAYNISPSGEEDIALEAIYKKD